MVQSDLNGRMMCNMSKVSNFVLKAQNLHVSAFKRSLPTLHKSSLHARRVSATDENTCLKAVWFLFENLLKLTLTMS